MRTTLAAIICLLAGFTLVAALDTVITRDVVLTSETFDEVAVRVIDSPQARAQLGEELVANWLILDMERVDTVLAFGPDGKDLIFEIAAATTETETFRASYFDAVEEFKAVGLDGEGTVIVDLAPAIAAANDGSLSPRAQLLVQEIDGFPLEADYTFTRDPGPTTLQLLRNATVVLLIIAVVLYAIANRLHRDPLVAIRRILWCTTGLLGAQVIAVPLLVHMLSVGEEPIETILVEVVVRSVLGPMLLAALLSAVVLIATVLIPNRRRSEPSQVDNDPITPTVGTRSLVEV